MLNDVVLQRSTICDDYSVFLNCDDDEASRKGRHAATNVEFEVGGCGGLDLLLSFSAIIIYYILEGSILGIFSSVHKFTHAHFIMVVN